LATAASKPRGLFAGKGGGEIELVGELLLQREQALEQVRLPLRVRWRGGKVVEADYSHFD